jgi:hypothetical protein
LRTATPPQPSTLFGPIEADPLALTPNWKVCSATSSCLVATAEEGGRPTAAASIALCDASHRWRRPVGAGVESPSSRRSTSRAGPQPLVNGRCPVRAPASLVVRAKTELRELDREPDLRWACACSASSYPAPRPSWPKARARATINRLRTAPARRETLSPWFITAPPWQGPLGASVGSCDATMRSLSQRTHCAILLFFVKHRVMDPTPDLRWALGPLFCFTLSFFFSSSGPTRAPPSDRNIGTVRAPAAPTVEKYRYVQAASTPAACVCAGVRSTGASPLCRSIDRSIDRVSVTKRQKRRRCSWLVARALAHTGAVLLLPRLVLPLCRPTPYARLCPPFFRTRFTFVIPSVPAQDLVRRLRPVRTT